MEFSALKADVHISGWAQNGVDIGFLVQKLHGNACSTGKILQYFCIFSVRRADRKIEQ